MTPVGTKTQESRKFGLKRREASLEPLSLRNLNEAREARSQAAHPKSYSAKTCVYVRAFVRASALTFARGTRYVAPSS